MSEPWSGAEAVYPCNLGPSNLHDKRSPEWTNGPPSPILSPAKVSPGALARALALRPRARLGVYKWNWTPDERVGDRVLGEEP